MRTVYVGLGSNVEPERNLRHASEELRWVFPSVMFSSVYKTSPQEREDQPDFLNTVAVCVTGDAPETLLLKLQRIERALGKSPPYRFGPRTIDLDLLLYDDLVLPNRETWKRNQESGIGNQENTLCVPHMRMHERRFVLEPLCGVLDPNGKHPALGETWKELLQKAKNQRCDRVDFLL